ncbi:MAG: hypothetical protein FLDDKLPJ_03740 [Phycisphaerae bacterium]|nr:hypothetical protein [Phycisphaerae bacterium]
MLTLGVAFSIFIITLTAFIAAFRRAGLFGGFGNAVAALAVAILAVLGIADLHGPRVVPSEQGNGVVVEFILLPYAELGLTILAVFLFAVLWWLVRTIRKGERRDSRSQADNEPCSEAPLRP